jgi:hypothetical protein
VSRLIAYYPLDRSIEKPITFIEFHLGKNVQTPLIGTKKEGLLNEDHLKVAYH